MRSNRKVVIIIAIILGFIGYQFFSNKTSGAAGFIEKNLPVAEMQIANLNDQLKNDQLKNAVKLKTYLATLGNGSHEHAAVGAEFIKETKPNSPSIQAFKNRLDDVRYAEKQGTTEAAELEAILLGTKPEVFNESFIDILNTVSDLTANTVPRVAMPGNKAAGADLYTNGAGAHLVGNERFGHWANTGGDKTWVWQGLLAGSALYGACKFSQWSKRRGWSYYNDTGRGLFGSSSARRSAGYMPKTNSLFRPSAVTQNFMGSNCNSRFSGSRSSGCNSDSNGYYGRNNFRSSHRNSSRSRGGFGGK